MTDFTQAIAQAIANSKTQPIPIGGGGGGVTGAPLKSESMDVQANLGALGDIIQDKFLWKYSPVRARARAEIIRSGLSQMKPDEIAKNELTPETQKQYRIMYNHAPDMFLIDKNGNYHMMMPEVTDAQKDKADLGNKQADTGVKTATGNLYAAETETINQKRIHEVAKVQQEARNVELQNILASVEGTIAKYREGHAPEIVQNELAEARKKLQLMQAQSNELNAGARKSDVEASDILATQDIRKKVMESQVEETMAKAWQFKRGFQAQLQQDLNLTREKILSDEKIAGIQANAKGVDLADDPMFQSIKLMSDQTASAWNTIVSNQDIDPQDKPMEMARVSMSTLAPFRAMTQTGSGAYVPQVLQYPALEKWASQTFENLFAGIVQLKEKGEWGGDKTSQRALDMLEAYESLYNMVYQPISDQLQQLPQGDPRIAELQQYGDLRVEKMYWAVRKMCANVDLMPMSPQEEQISNQLLGDSTPLTSPLFKSLYDIGE